MTIASFRSPTALLPLALLVACSGGDGATTAPAPAPAPVVKPSPVPPPQLDNPDAPTEPFALSPQLPPGFPDLRSGGAVQFPLHRLSGRYDIGTPKIPPRIAEATNAFRVPVEELPNPRGAERKLMVFKAELPFPVSSDEKTFRPVGMVVRVDGEEIDFARGPAPKAEKSTWRINGPHVVISHPQLPEGGEIEIEYPGVVDTLDRHLPQRNELSPEAFVRYGITIDRHTRHGLLLPSPSAAEWDLTVPAEGATFSTWVALEPAPLRMPKTDGADVVLSATVDGKKQELGRYAVEPEATGYSRWTVDLASLAGKEITLELRTESRETAVFDWVFLGSPEVSGKPAGDVRRIIVIGFDTTRYDHIGVNGYGLPSTPELDAFAKQSYVFDKAWTPAPRTRPSFRSATTGRRPLQAVGAENISEVFQREGFATAAIVANPHLQPRFGFDRGFDSFHFDGRADAEGQVDMALDWLKSHQDRDTYMFLHFMDPHMIYDAPGTWRNKFVKEEDPDLPRRVERAKVLAMMKQGVLNDVQKEQLEALHDGEMAYLSHEMGRFVAAVDQLPGKSLIVIHNDHGEEFWEHDGFEHNHTLYDEVTRAILWVRPGKGLDTGMRLDAPATLADIAPTLYDAVGVDQFAGTDGRSLLRPILGADDWADRPIPIGQIQYSHERWGVVYKGHKYVLHTGTGREELYDMTADPAEKQDKAATTDLGPYRAALARAHSIDVGPGWRVRVDLTDVPELTIKLPEGVLSASVLDPEAVAEHRANIEWGEMPKVLPSDVGFVKLSDDKRSLSFAPGTHGKGTLLVRFEQEQTAQAAQILVGDEPKELSAGKGGRAWKEGDRSVRIEEGIVVVPPPTEAERMGLLDAVDEAVRKQLCELGYVEEGCD